jgi:response regulator RpfG family c-di-GMP phosphodiesterase
MRLTERNIVVVDDERYVCNIILEALGEFDDFHVRKFTNPEKAIKYISDNGIDLVLTDLVMGDHSGVEVLEATRQCHPDAIVILMTGYPTVKTAISVLKKGGYDYLIKPFKLEDLKSTILRGLEHQRVSRENVELRSQIELMKISDELSRGMKLYPLLKMIVETALREISAIGASIMLLDRKAKRYRVRYVSGKQSEDVVDEFLNGEGPYGALTTEPERGKIFDEKIEAKGDRLKRSFVVYPLISRGKTIGFLNLVADNKFSYITPGQRNLIALMASTAASAVENSYIAKNLRRSYILTIKALANAVEARDKYTAGHNDRVYRLARITAIQLGWPKEKMNDLRTGCILHDIGKIGIPDCILNKPGRLNEREREIMTAHPQTGEKILRRIPFLRGVIPYIIAHHEKYDGTGYPYGLAGEDIPIEGRLLAVADTFDAIMSDRPYRMKANPEMAIDELTKFSGTQFDPKVVDAFITAYESGLIDYQSIYGRVNSEVAKVKQQAVSA